MQGFTTGATRSADDGKPDFEGFLSPLVLDAYAAYMQEHRTQDDGKVRASDNWQRGIPFHKYMKSLWRHFMQLWRLHRGWSVEPEKRAGQLVPVTVTSAVSGILFNTMGYFHEYLKAPNTWETRIISELEETVTLNPTPAPSKYELGQTLQQLPAPPWPTKEQLEELAKVQQEIQRQRIAMTPQFVYAPYPSAIKPSDVKLDPGPQTGGWTGPTEKASDPYPERAAAGQQGSKGFVFQRSYIREDDLD